MALPVPLKGALALARARGEEAGSQPSSRKRLLLSSATANLVRVTGSELEGADDSQSTSSSSSKVKERIVYFDFDCTISAVHVWKCLAGYEEAGPNSDRASIDPPHYYSERGQLSRACQLGPEWSESVLGGPSRIKSLRSIFRRLHCEPGLKLCVMSKGCVGAIRKILKDTGLLHFFERVFASNYGDPDQGQVKIPAEYLDLLAKEEDYLIEAPDAKLATMLRDLESRGMTPKQGMLIDDDMEEIRIVKSTMPTVPVKGRGGFGYAEAMMLLQQLDMNTFPYLVDERAWDVPRVVVEIPLPPTQLQRMRETIHQQVVVRREGCCVFADQDEDFDPLLNLEEDGKSLTLPGESASEKPKTMLVELMDFSQEQMTLAASTHKYTLTAMIARGRFGVTFQARSKPDGPLMYLKRVSKGRSADLTKFKKVKHGSLVPLVDLFVGEKYAFVVTLGYAGNLTFALGKLSEQDEDISVRWVSSTLRAAAEGLQYLHSSLSSGHGNVRPENIIFDRMPKSVSDFPNVRIADFAASCRSAVHPVTRRPCPFSAPELIVRAEDSSLPADVWAFGVTLRLVLQGRARLPASRWRRFLLYIKTAKATEEVKESDGLLNMILQQDPSKRPKFDQVLKHSFFKKKPATTPNYTLPREVCQMHRGRARARHLYKPLLLLVEERARRLCGNTKEAFAKADSNNDRALTLEEFADYWDLVDYPPEVPKPKVEEILCLVDTNEDGAVVFDEWASFFYSLRFTDDPTLLQHITMAYNTLPGVIQNKGLTCHALRRLFPNEPFDAVKALFDEMDVDCEGIISVQMFSDFIIELTGEHL